jgi:hypothetical protein
MNPPPHVLFLAAVVLVLGCQAPYGAPSQHGVDPRRTPEQTAVALETPPLEVDANGRRYRLAPLARYEIAARVLSRERYYLGWRADLSPMDLALGWGVLADSRVDQFIDWHQADRWYFYQWSADSPYRNDDIVPHSGNVHVIPANTNLRRILLSIERNQVLALSGQLVRVDDPAAAADGGWSSSLSRTDIGRSFHFQNVRLFGATSSSVASFAVRPWSRQRSMRSPRRLVSDRTRDTRPFRNPAARPSRYLEFAGAPTFSCLRPQTC